MSAPDPLSPDPAIARLATTRGLLALALPLAAGMGVGFLLHFTNRLFLSWYSPEAVAASLPAGMLAWGVQGFFIMTAGYVGTFTAQHHAAGEDDEAGAMFWPALFMGGIACLVSLCLIPFRDALVSLFGLQDPLVAAGMSELFGWYLAETGPIVLISAISGFYAGLGRTRLVFVLSAASCAVSVVLNYWLIFGGAGVPRLGITGAGLATLGTSVLFLFIWSAFVLGPDLRQRFGIWRNRNLDLARLRRFCHYALPRGGSEILEMIAFLVFSAAITRLPTESVSASNIAFSLYLLVLVPMIGLGQGVAIAVGQCLGAGQRELARQVGWRAIRIVMPALLIIALLFIFAPHYLMSIYVASNSSTDPSVAERWTEILRQGAPVLICLGIAAVGDGIQWVFRMVVVGAGDTRWTLVAMVSTAVLTLSIPVWWLLRVADPALLASWQISPLTASYIVFTIYSWLIALIMFLRFRFGPWQRMSVRQ